ncbi:MAG: Nramp family divalent metal transporter [Saprospiraceae bacterium]
MQFKEEPMPSLSEVNASVDVMKATSNRRKLFSFLGPAYLISVGYMDPGNWATDLAGGSQFGYKLLWVLLMSNLIALLLQSLSARLGIVRSRDLAQASREMYPGFVNTYLYILAEIAIAACDLAEVLGMAIGLQLLFHLPLVWGVSITVLDTFLVLLLFNYGMRKLEVFILSLIAIIALSFLAQMFFAQPNIGEIFTGLVPGIPNSAALYIAIGIIGATVMPHNLYLHSSLVQTRKFLRNPSEIKKAIKYNIIDSVIALNLAFFVNAAILILAASVFFKNGLFSIAEIQDAYKLLQPMLGTRWAPILFAVALIAAGQSSTITGTLAGQVIMEGYLNLRIAPWVRRLMTRLIAIVPALIIINLIGEGATGSLLILSQVILSLQLGFAIIPLIHFVSDREKMKEFTIKIHVKVMAWISAAIIVGLNAKLVIDTMNGWMMTPGENNWILKITVLPVAIFTAVILLYITFMPLIIRKKKYREPLPHGTFSEFSTVVPNRYSRIAITIDFTKTDHNTIRHAILQGGKDAEYRLIHVVETAGALAFGKEIRDYESESDEKNLMMYSENLTKLGYRNSIAMGYGRPKIGIVQKVKEFNADLLVMGAHGHKAFMDMLFGTTVDDVRHALEIPVLIVR